MKKLLVVLLLMASSAWATAPTFTVYVYQCKGDTCTTLAAIYADSRGLIPKTNPFLTDAAGVGDFYVMGAGHYKIVPILNRGR